MSQFSSKERSRFAENLDSRWIRSKSNETRELEEILAKIIDES